jgi:hypothetical protein
MSGRNAKECQCSAIYGAVLLCIALLLLSGCSAKPQLEPLVQVGADQFGAEGAFLTFEVQPEEDAPFRLSRTSPAGRRLAQIIKPAEHKIVRVIVGGPSSESSKRAILEALSLNKGAMLGGLEIVFVGEAIDAREVAQAARPMLATVHFRDVVSLQ